MNNNENIEIEVNKNLLPMTKICVKDLNSYMYFGAYFKVNFIGVVNNEKFEIMIELIEKKSNISNYFVINGNPSTQLMYSEILEKTKVGDFTRSRGN